MTTKRSCAFYAAALAILASVYPGPARAKQIPLFNPYPKLDLGYWSLSDGWVNGDHQSCEWRASAVFGENNKVQLRLSDQGGKIRPIGCSEIRTKENTSFGLYEARIRTAAGSGLNTAFFTYIGPPLGPEHDEIDFEFLGKDPHSVSITHYANGKNSKGAVVPLGFDASKGFHDYAIEWLPTKIRWFVDGKQVFESLAGDPMPKNPTHIYLSLWSGSQIEDAWMGPFHYTAPISAEVEWVKFTPLR